MPDNEVRYEPTIGGVLKTFCEGFDSFVRLNLKEFELIEFCNLMNKRLGNQVPIIAGSNPAITGGASPSGAASCSTAGDV